METGVIQSFWQKISSFFGEDIYNFGVEKGKVAIGKKENLVIVEDNLFLNVIKVDIDEKNDEHVKEAIKRAILLFGEEIEKIRVSETKKGYHIRVFLQKNSNEIINIHHNKVINHYLMEMVCYDDIIRVFLNIERYVKYKKTTDFLFELKWKQTNGNIVFSGERKWTEWKLEVIKHSDTYKKRVEEFFSKIPEEIQYRKFANSMLKYKMIEKIEEKIGKYVIIPKKEYKEYIYYLQNGDFLVDIFKNIEIEKKNENIIQVKGKKVFYLLIRQKEGEENEYIAFFKIKKELEQKIEELKKRFN